MEGLLNILQQGSHMHGRWGMLRTIYSKLSRNKAPANHLVVLLTESTARWWFQRFPKFLFQPYTCHKKVQILDPIKKCDALMGSGVPNDWPSLGSAWLPRWGVMCRFLGLSLAKTGDPLEIYEIYKITLWWIDKYIHMAPRGFTQVLAAKDGNTAPRDSTVNGQKTLFTICSPVHD